jgi:hypothetical protein
VQGKDKSWELSETLISGTLCALPIQPSRVVDAAAPKVLVQRVDDNTAEVLVSQRFRVQLGAAVNSSGRPAAVPLLQASAAVQQSQDAGIRCAAQLGNWLVGSSTDCPTICADARICVSAKNVQIHEFEHLHKLSHSSTGYAHAMHMLCTCYAHAMH